MLQRISESEMEVMQIIWGNGGKIQFAPLMKLISRNSISWSKNTVLTFLVRLTDKGYLSATKIGRLKEYTASVSEDEYLEEQAGIFLHQVYGGNVKHLVSTLLKYKGITEEDFLEIQDFWMKGSNVK